MYFTKHTYLNFKTCMFFARYYFVKAKHVCYFFKFKTCLLYTKHYYAKAKHVCHTQNIILLRQNMSKQNLFWIQKKLMLNMFVLHKTLFCQFKICLLYTKHYFVKGKHVFHIQNTIILMQNMFALPKTLFCKFKTSDE